MNENGSPRRRRGLGMGLSALLGGDEAMGAPAAVGHKGLQSVPIEFLRPSPLQPRRRFGDEELDALAASLREKGVLQPLLARPAANGSPGYEIVAGERRWRAAQRAGLHEVPVIVRELDDRAVLEIGLVENLQRENLTALEEAEAYRRLVDELGRTQEELAEAVGRSRSHIANTLRLLALPEEVKALLEEGKLTAGHARALLGVPGAAALARQVVEKGLSVRETEALARRQGEAARRRRAARRRDPNIVEVEETLAARLGMRVTIRRRRQGGTLEIRFSSLDQLDALMQRLTGADPQSFGG